MAMTNFLKTQTFNENRTFGVEIEFFGTTARKVIEALENAGINVRHESYNHTTRSHWKLVSDVSVNNTGTGLSSGGHELVSPILKGKRGLEELKNVMEALTTAGAKVDRTCGLHVHHGVNDFTVENFKTIFTLYYKFENFFNAVVAPSRRENRFCQSIYRNEIDALENAASLTDIGRIFSSRYKKLNFQSFYRHNTIEFRQHGGTHEASKAVNWVIFTQAIVERAKLETVRLAKKDHDRDAVSTFNHERRLRRTLFGEVSRESLKSEYGQAMKFQMGRRTHFEAA